MRRTYRINHHAIDLDDLDPFICGARIRMDVKRDYTEGEDGESHSIEIDGSLLDALALAVSLAEKCEHVAGRRLTPMNADAVESSARQLREWATNIELAARRMPPGPQGAA